MYIEDIIMLYDLTNAYFEGRKEGTQLAKFAAAKKNAAMPSWVVLALVVNFELKHRLLMMSTQARVVKPLSLKMEMEKLLTEAQNFYKN